MPPRGVDPCKGDNDLSYVNNANAWSMLPLPFPPPPSRRTPEMCIFFLLVPGSLFPTPGHAKGKDIIPHPELLIGLIYVILGKSLYEQN